MFAMAGGSSGERNRENIVSAAMGGYQDAGYPHFHLIDEREGIDIETSVRMRTTHGVNLLRVLPLQWTPSFTPHL
jgi:hypothetical protein